jgi:hypothetical protein
VIDESVAMGIAGAAVGVGLGFAGAAIITAVAPKLSATVGGNTGPLPSLPAGSLGSWRIARLRPANTLSRVIWPALAACGSPEAAPKARFLT